MRLLHTADWHLGHRLYDRDRTDEHRMALAWLLKTIEQEAIDVLVIAGDIFDVTNPSNQARELYYAFLGRLIQTRCTAAVIIGGNHDSAAMLDAPRGLLQSLQLHVVGAARPDLAEEVIRIKLTDETVPSVLVAAVPYLRERDLRKGQFGEAEDDRLVAIREGIRNHYAEVATLATAMRANPAEPIIATGHLFASGAADAEDKVSHIYQADEHNIEAGQFPDCFDYVALGHVHRAQHVGGQDHVRYAGSLIPLTFLEGQRPRSICIVDIEAGGKEVSTRKLAVPYGRNLHRVHGTLEAISLELQTLATRYLAEQPVLTPWVEVRIKTDVRIPNLRQTLLHSIQEVSGHEDKELPLQLVRLSAERLSPAPASAPEDRRQLEELEPTEVLQRLLDAQGTPPDEGKTILADFRALRNWWEDEMAEA
ncbi:MAG: exonuclease SbcCD subunit D C-terminal domain-containing protein [Bacteroidota bacterium]